MEVTIELCKIKRTKRTETITWLNNKPNTKTLMNDTQIYYNGEWCDYVPLIGYRTTYEIINHNMGFKCLKKNPVHF